MQQLQREETRREEAAGRPTLAIFVTDRRMKSYLVESIHNIIGDQILVRGYSIDEGHGSPLRADLVLTSGVFIHDIAQQTFPGCPVIDSKRVVTGRNLEHILMTPPGKRALVVNHPRTVSRETLESLRRLGMDHLVYMEYEKGMYVEPGSVDLIITPGMAHVAPPELDVPVIDIGERAVSVGTFGKILQFFGLEMDYLNAFEETHVRHHVDASRRIKDSLDHSEELRRHQSIILREIDEGILAMDQDGKVVVSNPIIEQMFGPADHLADNCVLQKALHKLDGEETEEDELSESQRSTALLVRHNDKSIYCRKNIIEVGRGKQFFYTFKSVDAIQRLEQTVRRRIYHKGFQARYTFDDILGSHPGLLRAKEKARRFAATDQTVLITGESGTGKELFAQSVHNASKRVHAPFVAVNMAAISRTLLESELFGYSEGAFTGAKKGGKQGLFELAHGGTIFLDEIGDAPLHIQLLLLRVLEERTITRVGGEQNIPVDVRIIAATNKSLEEAIQKGRFRQDLFFRLNVLPVRTVALRHMREEIPLFIEKYVKPRFHTVKALAPELRDLLLQYEWPGNFRELNNVSDYLYYSAEGADTAVPEDLPDYILDSLFSLVSLEEEFRKDPRLTAALGLLAEANPGSVSRASLCGGLEKRGYAVTEGEARGLLAAMREARVCRPGTTRQGTFITELGLKLHGALVSGGGEGAGKAPKSHRQG